MTVYNLAILSCFYLCWKIRITDGKLILPKRKVFQFRTGCVHSQYNFTKWNRNSLNSANLLNHSRILSGTFFTSFITKIIKFNGNRRKHSSRMRTTRLLTIFRSIPCICGRSAQPPGCKTPR